MYILMCCLNNYLDGVLYLQLIIRKASEAGTSTGTTYV
jgi:hypothetical protein